MSTKIPKLQNLIIFSLFITLLLGMSNNDVINIKDRNGVISNSNNHHKEREIMVEKSIYTQHFISLFGQ